MGMFDMIGTGSILFAIVMTVGAFFVVYRVISSLSRGEKERQRLLQSGVQAQARILNVQMGSMTVTTGVNRQLQLQLAVEVHRPGAAPYQAQFATMVSELQIPQVQPGAWMGVRVDPANPQNMAIEALGIPPPGTPGAPPYGAPPGMPGANPYAAPVGIGAPAAGMGMAPMGGFRLGTGARDRARGGPARRGGRARRGGDGDGMGERRRRAERGVQARGGVLPQGGRVGVQLRQPHEAERARRGHGLRGVAEGLPQVRALQVRAPMSQGAQR